MISKKLSVSKNNNSNLKKRVRDFSREIPSNTKYHMKAKVFIILTFLIFSRPRLLSLCKA